MTRDGEMRARDCVDLVLANIGDETDAWAVTRIPSSTALAVNSYSAPAHRAELRATWERGLRELLLAAEPGSDHQLTFARSYAAAAHSDAALDDLDRPARRLLHDRGPRRRPGPALGAHHRAGEVRPLRRRRDRRRARGRQHHLRQGAGRRRPGLAAHRGGQGGRLERRSSTRRRPTRRRARWSSRSSASARRTCSRRTSRSSSTRPTTVIDTLGFHKASTVLEYGFPKPLGSQATLDARRRVAGRQQRPQGRAALRRRGAGRDRPGARRPGLRRPLTDGTSLAGRPRRRRRISRSAIGAVRRLDARARGSAAGHSSARQRPLRRGGCSAGGRARRASRCRAGARSSRSPAANSDVMASTASSTSASVR